MVCNVCGKHLQPNATSCVWCGTAADYASGTESDNYGEECSQPAQQPRGCLGCLARLFRGSLETTPRPVEPLGREISSASLQANPASASTLTQEVLPETLPYRLNSKFLTPAEVEFFHMLQLAQPEGTVLCPKVNLQDLFWVPPYDYTARNRIDRKHVDFVLADDLSLQPLCGIELDDRSHQRPDRQERDRFVEAVFAATGLPVVRVPLHADYDPDKLAAELRTAIAEAPVARTTTPPPCPKCRTTMVVRTAKNGRNAGRQFYGCPNYPHCNGMVSI